VPWNPAVPFNDAISDGEVTIIGYTDLNGIIIPNSVTTIGD
jgi:hypothetical protein